MVTWEELKTEIEQEYDLAEENFVTSSELVAFANEAIDDVEAEIHSINDKYFETETEVNIIAGVSEYDLPADIYAFKITSIFLKNGANSYEIKPLKDKRKILDVQSNDRLRYRIINSSTGAKIKFYPTPVEDVFLGLNIHYIRQANKITTDASIIDVPEAKSFIKQYVVDKAANKERMTPDAPESAALKRKRVLLIETLSTMIQDENDTIEPDLQLIEEHV